MRLSRPLSAALALLLAVPFAAEQPTLTPAEAVALAGRRDGAVPLQMEWSADGQRLLLLEPAPEGRPGDLVTLDPTTLKRKVLLSPGQLSAALAAPGSAGPAPTVRGFTVLKGDRLLLRTSSGLFLYEPGSTTLLRVLSSEEGAENPALAPDATSAAYTRGGSLYVRPLPAGPARLLAKGSAPDLLCGEPDWLYGEELDLSTAFWWSTDSKRIAFLVFDERAVPDYPLPELTEVHPEPGPQKYPRPGDPNPAVHLEVVDLATGVRSAVPGAESGEGYLPWAAWTPDGGALFFSRLNRAQDRLEILRWEVGSAAPVPLFTESAAAWVNVLGPPRFLSDGRFLWTSERDGFAHLYLSDAAGSRLTPLTAGPWVVDDILAVDEKAGVVFFSANRDGALGQQVYRVSLHGGPSTRLSGAGGWHDGAVAPTGRWLLDRRSDHATPVEAALVDLSGRRPERVLHRASRAEYDRYGFCAPEFVEIPAADGTVLHGQLTRPRGFDPARKYPVVIEVYGGPGMQVVQDRWSGRWEPVYQMFLQRGFVLFSVDNRGSARRGREFESATLKRLGERELADQLEGLSWLRRQPFVDGARVGIWGWSYGGTMTCYALAHAPAGSFAAGVAVAPVTDWLNYDTCYTERYMKRPAENTEGYEAASPARAAERFTAPVLLLHGLADDNVHFGNSAQMADALLKAGKPFESQYYPRMTHSIHERPARADLFARMLAFFEEHLKR